ncbi:MAG: hypothetical protein AB7N24_02065 [Dehalococcoidia bacterium]
MKVISFLERNSDDGKILRFADVPRRGTLEQNAIRLLRLTRIFLSGPADTIS